MVADREIGLAARKISGLPRRNQLDRDASRHFWRASGERAGKENRGPFTDGDPYRPAQCRRCRCAPPLQHQRRMFDTFRCGNQMLAGGVEAQPLGQAVEQSRPTERRLECRETSADRRLAQPQRTTGGAQRPVSSDREEDTNIVPIHRRAITRLRAPFLRAATEFRPRNHRFVKSYHDTFLYRYVSDLSSLDINSYHQIYRQRETDSLGWR